MTATPFSAGAGGTLSGGSSPFSIHAVSLPTRFCWASITNNAAFSPTSERFCAPFCRVIAFASCTVCKNALMVAGSSVISCHGLIRQCSPLSESGAPSNNRRGAISLSLTLDDSSPPSSIRNTASVCAPALRLKVMTRPWCSPVLRATQKFWLLHVTCQSENACCAGAAQSNRAGSNPSRKRRITR